MRKKITILLVTLIAVLLLCSCGKVDITCTVTQENLAVLEMKVEVPKDGIGEKDLSTMRSAIHKVYNYWKQRGLEVTESLYGNPIVLEGKWEKQANNEKEAYDALLSFMTDGLSPFTEVEGGYSPAFFSNKRYLKAKLDLSHVVGASTIDALPPSQRQSIIDKIDSMQGRVTLDLPGDVIDSDGIVDQNTVYKQLDFDKEITIMVTTEYKNLENIDEHNGLVNSLPQQKKSLLIIAIAFFVLLLIAIFAVMLFCKVLKRKRNNDT